MPFVCLVATAIDSTPMACDIYILPNVYSPAFLHKLLSLDSLKQAYNNLVNSLQTGSKQLLCVGYAEKLH